AQTEHELIPCVGIAPTCDLITPRRVMLRTTQTIRLVSAVTGGNRTILPRQPTQPRLILRPIVLRTDGQDAALAFDHDVPDIGCGGANQRQPRAARHD